MNLLDSPSAALLRRSCSAHDRAAGACPDCARVAEALLKPLPDEAFAERVAQRIAAYFAFLALEGLTPEEDELDVAEMYEDAIADAFTEEPEPTPAEVEEWRSGAFGRRSYAIEAAPDEDDPPPKPPRKRQWQPTGWPVGRPRKGVIIQGGWWGTWLVIEPQVKKKLPSQGQSLAESAAAGGTA
jgi:hypothetical protein